MKVSISGVVFVIYPRDHMPPHVHLIYDGGRAKAGLEDGKLMKGRFPKGREGRIKKIIALHAAEWTDTFYRLNPHLK